MELSYAGIGSRKTPIEVIKLFENIGMELANLGFVLRSGHADGADSAFENGCDMVNGGKEIYLPWGFFNGSTSKLIVQDINAFKIAEKYHPRWDFISSSVQKLQARNSHQILGNDLNSPCNFVVCWTKNGKGDGGTGQALRIAKSKGIRVFDCGNYTDLEKFKIKVLKYANELINIFKNNK